MFFKPKLKIEIVRSTIVWVRRGYKKALELEIFPEGELPSGNNFENFLDYLLRVRFFDDPEHKDRQAIKEKVDLNSMVFGKTLPAITVGILAAKRGLTNCRELNKQNF